MKAQNLEIAQCPIKNYPIKDQKARKYKKKKGRN